MGSLLQTLEQSDSVLQLHNTKHSDSRVNTMEQSNSRVYTTEQSDSRVHTMEQSDSIQHTMEQTQPRNKRVTWDNNLYEIRMISPREEKKVFSLQTSRQEDTSNHTIYQITQPSEVKTQSGVFLSKFYLPKTNKSQLNPGQLGCSEQLQTVVDRARKMKQISNNNDNMGYTWQPDRSKLKLHFE